VRAPLLPRLSQLDGPQLSEEEQREHLLGKVKADNAQITECERRLSEAQDAIRAGKKQLAKLANDVNEANDPKGVCLCAECPKPPPYRDAAD